MVRNLVALAGWESSAELYVDLLKIALLLTIGLLALRILRRLDGTTPPELRAQVQALAAQIISVQGEERKLAGEFALFRGSIEELRVGLRSLTSLRDEIRTIHEKMETMRRISCDDCPVIRGDPEVELGFRRVKPRSKG